MNSCELDVLRDGILYNFALLGNSVKLNLLRILHELRNDNRIVLADLGGHIEEAVELLVAVADVHSGS